MPDHHLRSQRLRGNAAARPAAASTAARSSAIPSVLPAESPVRGAQPAAPAAVVGARVDLGPELPMAIFTSTEVWNPERVGALAIYCSDGRWGEAFDEFCHRRLQIPRYDRMAIAGGPVWFASPDRGTGTFAEALHEQLAFLVKVHELERVILITHYGCAFYGERLHKSPDECLPGQLEDLRLGAQTLHGWFPGIQVEAYLAMRRGSYLSFHWLNT